MKKVLIALDYDPTAQKVAETGFAIAKSMHAEITILHVIADNTYYSALEYTPIMGFMGFGNADASRLTDTDGLKNAIGHYLEKTKQHLGDSTIRTLVREGEYAETILKTANEIHADMIVMGSHSRKWLEEILMGSITEDVLHHTTIPLFIVPTKKHS